jgi:hypothetical protein
MRTINCASSTPSERNRAPGPLGVDPPGSSPSPPPDPVGSVGPGLAGSAFGNLSWTLEAYYKRTGHSRKRFPQRPVSAIVGEYNKVEEGLAQEEDPIDGLKLRERRSGLVRELASAGIEL